MTLMMVERHYDDEALIALMEAGREQADAHLPSCTVCRDKLDSFSMIADTLHDPDVWDTRPLHYAPVPATIATLRAFADRMTAEEAAAAAILAELLSGPREEWMPRLREHPEWRTAGVVRDLIVRIRATMTAMPPDALEMTHLAVEMAENLASLAVDVVSRLRGSAWREKAYALFYVGRYDDALAAVERAEVHFQACIVDEYERARVSIVRALILRVKEDPVSAMTAVMFGVETFTHFDDIAGLASARLAEAHLLFSRDEFQVAASILEDLQQKIADTADGSTHARVLGNLGYCYWKLGRYADSLRHQDAAAALLDDLGIHTEATRSRWNVASVLASAGYLDEARRRFDGLKKTFDQLGMTSEATLVSLDIAELLLVREDFAEVEEICRTAMRSFETAGIAYTARARTALAFMQEASQHRTATVDLLKHVREYIRRLPEECELLFAPPPLANFVEI